jgi:hypothetical protein
MPKGMKSKKPQILPKLMPRRSSVLKVSLFSVVGALLLGGLFDQAAANTSCTDQAKTGVTAVVVGTTDCLITFSGTGTHTWQLPAGVSTVSILIIGGGGGGGSGGGGAGGFLERSNETLLSGSYSVTVGAGGAASTGGFAQGSPGGSSSFSSWSAGGGGGGGRGDRVGTREGGDAPPGFTVNGSGGGAG